MCNGIIEKLSNATTVIHLPDKYMWVSGNCYARGLFAQISTVELSEMLITYLAYSLYPCHGGRVIVIYCVSLVTCLSFCDRLYLVCHNFSLCHFSCFVLDLYRTSSNVQIYKTLYRTLGHICDLDRFVHEYLFVDL